MDSSLSGELIAKYCQISLGKHRKITEISGDVAYDTKDSYAAIRSWAVGVSN
ncbi:hypothetical protein VCG_001310 [Vibrio cholerae 12129(1)]|nr:hypothetical protein VCG_001310 [Vibrio cholerae 12129(1)]